MPDSSSTPETCGTCAQMVTAEHLPWCPAEAAAKRARRWPQVAAIPALLATGALLAVVGRADHWHGGWLIVAGWVMVQCGLIPAIAEKWAAERERGPLLPKRLRAVLTAVAVYGFALLITQSHGHSRGPGMP